jgi:hypothetical protein
MQVTGSRIELQKLRRPSWVVEILEVIVEMHAGAHGPLLKQSSSHGRNGIYSVSKAVVLTWFCLAL